MRLIVLYALFLAGLAPAGMLSVWGQGDPVKIGLLVPDSTSGQIVEAAQKAIDRANQSRVYSHVFELTVRSTEGPWGMGSKQSVNLVYDDEVLAMVGWLDGRNAHLAEQVAAKSHITYLETRATDPTLSQAYVPWFFRMTPNDDQQARAIVELIHMEGGGNTAILNQEDYETRYAVKSLIKETANQQGKAPLLIAVPQEESDIELVISQLNNAGIRHLILPFFNPSVLRLLQQLNEELPLLQAYGTLAFTIALEEYAPDPGSLSSIHLIYSYSEGDPAPEAVLSASYVTDGIHLILRVIEEAGADRDRLKAHLGKVENFKGLSGPVIFDELGNRTGTLYIISAPIPN